MTVHKSYVSVPYWRTLKTGPVSEHEAVSQTLLHNKTVLEMPCWVIMSFCFENISFPPYLGHTTEHRSLNLSVIYLRVLRVWHPSQQHPQHCLCSSICSIVWAPQNLTSRLAADLLSQTRPRGWGPAMHACQQALPESLHTTQDWHHWRLVTLFYSFLSLDSLFLPLPGLPSFMTSLPTLREKMNSGPISSTLFMTEGAFSSEEIS